MSGCAVPMLCPRIVFRVTDATRADRTDMPGSVLAELADAFGIEEVRERRYLADGLMNVNWKVDTPVGPFALKRVTDVSLDRLSRNLGVLAALMRRRHPGQCSCHHLCRFTGRGGGWRRLVPVPVGGRCSCPGY